MRSCTISTCARRYSARGMCLQHYNEWRTTEMRRTALGYGLPGNREAELAASAARWIASRNGQ